MIRLLAAIALSSFVLLFACGPTEQPRKCTPQTCTGCCTAEDTCAEGTKIPACGVGGVTCKQCTDAEFCRNGNCTTSAGCASLGQDCTSSDQCCVGYACFSGKCGGGNTCTNAGGACMLTTDCCSNICSSGTCGAGAGCKPQGAPCTPCCQLGLTCQAGSCEPGGGGGGGGGGSSCTPLSGSCTSSTVCCGQYTCQSFVCR